MNPRHILLLSSLSMLASACPGSEQASGPDPAAAEKAKADEQAKARLEQRKQERLAKEQADKQQAEQVAQKIKEVATIPEGTKLPKKLTEACEQVVTAQQGFMKKYHPQVDDAAMTTQLGLLRKQCNDMKDIKVAVCQKFALEATTDQLKSAINEYLPTCMDKYGSKNAG